MLLVGAVMDSSCWVRQMTGVFQCGMCSAENVTKNIDFRLLRLKYSFIQETSKMYLSSYVS